MIQKLALTPDESTKLAALIREKREHIVRHGTGDPFTRGMLHGVESLAREMVYKLGVIDRETFLKSCGMDCR